MMTDHEWWHYQQPPKPPRGRRYQQPEDAPPPVRLSRDWARLEAMSIENLRALVQAQSDAALAELERSRLEKP